MSTVWPKEDKSYYEPREKFTIDLDSLVCGLDYFGNGVLKIRRRAMGTTPPRSDRTQVLKFTPRARQQMLFRLMTSCVTFESMITLTYGLCYPLNGQIAKLHWKRYIDGFRRLYDESYFWFLEFQRRGAIHFHVFTSRLEVTCFDRAQNANLWVRSIGYAPSRHYSVMAARKERDLADDCYSVHAHPTAWEVIREPQGALRYAAKYAFKQGQKDVPPTYSNVGRFWGCSQDVRNSNPEPVTSIDNIDASQVRYILDAAGHPASSFDALPTYVFGYTGFEDLTEGL